ncbi:5441_t:CDS:10 [Ambispora gerdemannii]|uniref:ubiquitinyl hydrolase 1 n=1 Tax=Ambispora gerdemannii TaxID=144530 RepID=A0A9N9EY44_9GLOM|nr:5441_t:CDS:10 [Ambispora gerdemannii]
MPLHVSSPLSPTTNTPSTNGIISKKENIKANGENSASSSQGIEDTLFGALKDLFTKISSQKKKTGVVAPFQFITKLKKENGIFSSTMHQDAHEFLNYLLNSIAETVLAQQKKMEEAERQQAEMNEKSKSSVEEAEASSTGGSVQTLSSSSNSATTWVHQLFEGITTNETKCLTCETVTNKDESFLDLSIDIEQNSSVTSCLRQFSASEMLCHKNKFFCDVCCGLQEAEKRMKIKKLPNVLALHLKRFKYQEKLQKYIKLSYRVVFPTELRLFNTCEDIEDPDRLYELYAICVHIGNGPYHGHYITLIKSLGQWLLFDDNNVEPVEESEIQKYFGDFQSGSGYVLFYQACDLNLNTLGLTTNTVWPQSVGSSGSSAEFEVSSESNEAQAIISPPSTTTVINSNITDTDKQYLLATIKENTTTTLFLPSGILSRRKKDHNTPDKRKSNGNHELSSKDNETTTQKSFFAFTENGSSSSKKDKKAAEKEAKKLEKKTKNSEKPKLTIPINGLHEKAVSM